MGPGVPVIERMKLGFKLLLVCASSIWAATLVVAGETATLRNGYSIQFDRRELRGGWTRLYLSASPDDFVDVLTDEIVGFEAEGMPPAPAPPAKDRKLKDLEEVVTLASTHSNLSPALIKSMIHAESGFNPNAVSRKGAQGLMQLMPETAARMGVRNAFDPSENVEGGARYLSELLGLFHDDVVKALAAYNAGPQRVEQYHGVPPFPETVAYVNKVIRGWNRPAELLEGPLGAEADPFRGPGLKKAAARQRKTLRGSTPASGEAPYFERRPLSLR